MKIFAVWKRARKIPRLVEFSLLTCCSFSADQAIAGVLPPLTAAIHDSGHDMNHDTWNGMGVGSDGRIYYVLCSESVDRGAQMFSFDPPTGRIRHLGDLTEACGEGRLKAVPQGKSHVRFVESDGKLYFATHLAYYSPGGGDPGAKEYKAAPPPGYAPYPGGHFLAYDMARGTFERLASVPAGEGILAMAMDVQRGRLYGLTWPTGYFVRYDLGKKQLKRFGPVAGQGEAGDGETYSALCRAIVVNADDGSAYLTTSAGEILRYDVEQDTLAPVPGVNLRKDYFGNYDSTKPGHMGYNWRQAFWHPREKKIYGLHGNSGYLFRFDPKKGIVEVLERMASVPSQRAGAFDKFRYGYLGFALGPDLRTIYYLTGGPFPAGHAPVPEGEPALRPEESLHLVTYDTLAEKYADHGAIVLSDGRTPSRVQSIAVDNQGTVYALSRVLRNGHFVPDLIQIPLGKPDTGKAPVCVNGVNHADKH